MGAKACVCFVRGWFELVEMLVLFIVCVYTYSSKFSIRFAWVQFSHLKILREAVRLLPNTPFEIHFELVASTFLPLSSHPNKKEASFYLRCLRRRDDYDNKKTVSHSTHTQFERTIDSHGNRRSKRRLCQTNSTWNDEPVFLSFSHFLLNNISVCIASSKWKASFAYLAFILCVGIYCYCSAAALYPQHRRLISHDKYFAPVMFCREIRIDSVWVVFCAAALTSHEEILRPSAVHNSINLVFLSWMSESESTYKQASELISSVETTKASNAHTHVLLTRHQSPIHPFYVCASDNRERKKKIFVNVLIFA